MRSFLGSVGSSVERALNWATAFHRNRVTYDREKTIPFSPFVFYSELSTLWFLPNDCLLGYNLYFSIGLSTKSFRLFTDKHTDLIEAELLNLTLFLERPRSNVMSGALAGLSYASVRKIGHDA